MKRIFFLGVFQVGLAILFFSGAAFLGGSAAQAVVIDLGAAGVYAGANLYGTNEFAISGGGTVINGNIFVGDTANFSDLYFSGGGKIKGTIDKAPDATVRTSGGSSATGGTVHLTAAQSAQVTTDLNAALSNINGLSATQTFSTQIKGGTISSTTNTNVVDFTEGMYLSGGSTLTFSGGANDWFIVRVGKSLMTTGDSNIYADGVGAGHLLFVVNGDVSMYGGTIDGTYISTNGSMQAHRGTHYGAYIQASPGKTLKFMSDPTVNFEGFQPSHVPIPGSVLLFGTGLLGIGLLGWRRRRN